MNYIILAFIGFIVLFIFSACKVSSNCSRWEEKNNKLEKE